MGETKKINSEKVLLVWWCTFYMHIQLFVHHSICREFIFWLKCLYFHVLLSCTKKLSNVFKYLVVVVLVKTSNLSYIDKTILHSTEVPYPS